LREETRARGADSAAYVAAELTMTDMLACVVCLCRRARGVRRIKRLAELADGQLIRDAQ
jgi:hypothetical protein